MNLPTDIVLIRAINGALSLLCDPENWETDGDSTPEETAEFFNEWFESYIDSTEDC